MTEEKEPCRYSDRYAIAMRRRIALYEFEAPEKNTEIEKRIAALLHVLDELEVVKPASKYYRGHAYIHLILKKWRLGEKTITEEEKLYLEDLENASEEPNPVENVIRFITDNINKIEEDFERVLSSFIEANLRR